MSRFTLTPRAAVVLAAVVVVVALVVIVLGGRGSDVGGTMSVSGAEPVAMGSSAPSGSPRVPTASASEPPVVVHVLGAVARAGLVTLPGGARVADALDAAGGAAADADVTRLNLARAVVDGERLYVPRVGETEIPSTLDGGTGGAADVGAGGASAGGGPSAVVDLNTADQAALETLPGIGPALAQRILAWRQEHGRFGSVQDLLDVSGIGDAKFADLESRVRV